MDENETIVGTHNAHKIIEMANGTKITLPPEKMRQIEKDKLFRTHDLPNKQNTTKQQQEQADEMIKLDNEIRQAIAKKEEYLYQKNQQAAADRTEFLMLERKKQHDEMKKIISEAIKSNIKKMPKSSRALAVACPYCFLPVPGSGQSSALVFLWQMPNGNVRCPKCGAEWHYTVNYLEVTL